MAIRTLQYLRTKFETGDKPTQADFTDLIETLYVTGGGGYTFDTAQDLRDYDPPGGIFPPYVITVGAISSDDKGGGGWHWDSDSILDDNLGTVLLPTGSTNAGRWLRAFTGNFHVAWWGAKGDGVAFDEGPIQAAIDYVTTLPRGGTIDFARDYDTNYSITSITLKNKVSLVGSTGGYRGNDSQPMLYGRDPDTRWIVVTAPQTKGASMTGLSIYGTGLGSKQGGLRNGESGTFWNTYDGLVFRDLGYQAILDGYNHSGTTASLIRDCLATRCLLEQDNLTEYMGVLQLESADSFIINGEYAANKIGVPALNRPMSASGMACACYNHTGALIQLIGCVFEIADIGYYADACVDAKLVSVRCDINSGHGFWLDEESSGIMTGCQAYANGQAAPGTYESFRFTGKTRWNLSNCVSTNKDWAYNTTQRAAFYVESGLPSDYFVSFSNCRHTGTLCTEKEFDTPISSGPDISGIRVAFLNVNAAEDVVWPTNLSWRVSSSQHRANIQLNNTTGSEIVVRSFPQGFDGQIMNVMINSYSGPITLTSTGGNILLTNFLNWQAPHASSMLLVFYNGKWREIGSQDLRLAPRTTAPSGTASPGVKGTYWIGTGYLYLCVATNTWVRIATGTW